MSASFPSTYERVLERTLVVVKKKDGTREQFSRDKIFNGIIRSAQKRPVSSDEINMVVNRIEQKLTRSRSENEIQSEYIGSLVMEELVELMRLPMFVLPVFTVALRM